MLDGEMSRGADTQEFLGAFDAFAQAVRRARGAPALAGDGALTLSQYALIQGLAERDCARVAELAADAGVTPSTATRILDVLERRGIVRRRRTPEDRRSVLVSLTDSGRDVLRARDQWQREIERSFYSGLPAAERELAPDLLLRLAELIDELAAGPER
jgi:MarR family transcriptional regulator, organic hydroperoxide resistance regulator